MRRLKVEFEAPHFEAQCFGEVRLIESARSRGLYSPFEEGICSEGGELQEDGAGRRRLREVPGVEAEQGQEQQ